MKMIYRQGDLLDAEELVIIHGCNAQGAMNSGVAKAIRERYPQAFADYANQHVKVGLTMGEVVWSVNDPHIVGNAITQQFYGRDPAVRYVSYDAVAEVVAGCNVLVHEGKIDAIGLPFLGAGLANGNWEVIEAIFETHADFQPVVYYLPELIPDGIPTELRLRLT